VKGEWDVVRRELVQVCRPGRLDTDQETHSQEPPRDPQREAEVLRDLTSRSFADSEKGDRTRAHRQAEEKSMNERVCGTKKKYERLPRQQQRLRMSVGWCRVFRGPRFLLCTRRKKKKPWCLEDSAPTRTTNYRPSGESRPRPIAERKGWSPPDQGGPFESRLGIC